MIIILDSNIVDIMIIKKYKVLPTIFYERETKYL